MLPLGNGGTSRPNFNPWVGNGQIFGDAGFAYPFQCARTIDGIIVRFGLVNFAGTNIIPKIGGVAITADWATNLVECLPTDVGYVLLEFEVADGDPYVPILDDKISLIFNSTIPTNTLTRRYFVICAAGPNLVQQWFTQLFVARAGDYSEIDNLRFW